MRRALSSAFALLVAMTTAARAQNLGTIYFAGSSDGTTLDGLYSIAGDGTNKTKVLDGNPFFYSPTSRSDYPGGRRFVATVPRGNSVVYQGRTYSCGSIVLLNAAGNSTPITDFPGPVIIESSFPASSWSNDGQDSFLSFVALDTAQGRYIHYRTLVTADEMLMPGFPPFTPDDLRLEVVLASPLGNRSAAAWRSDGAYFAYDGDYQDGAGNRQYRVLLHQVGTSVDGSTDFLINDQGVSGLKVTSLTYSPTADQVVGVGTRSATGEAGLVSFNPFVGAGSMSWLQKEARKSPPVRLMLYPKFSPDGTRVAFFGYTPFKQMPKLRDSVLTCPAAGGPVTTLIVTTTNYIRGWTW